MLTHHVRNLMAHVGFAAVAIAGVQLLGAMPARAGDQYGAISTNENGQWGYSYNYPTRAQAEAASLRECGKDDCEVRVWFANACGAVAENQKYIGWGWGETRAEAEAQAISSCGQGSCRVLTWACTDR